LRKLFSIRNHKIDARHILDNIAVDDRDIPGSQSLQFAAPARVRNFNPQDAIGEIERSGPGCDCASAGSWPSQQRRLPRGRGAQRPRHHFLQSSSGWIHFMMSVVHRSVETPILAS
jgi:hypothetical protein